MSKALFIDDVYLKQYSPVGKSMDVDDIYQFVEQSQDIYIQDILGTPLYNDLVDKLYNGITYSTAEMDLVDLCSKALCYWTCYTALPHIWIKMRNVGVAKQTSDNSQNSDLTELRYIREEMKNLAEFWNTRTVSTIGMAAATSFYEFEFNRNSATFTEDLVKSVEAGSAVFEQTLTITIPKRDVAKRNTLALLTQRDLAVIFKDANGIYWYPGDVEGMYLSESTSTSGTAKADGSNYVLTLKGFELERAPGVDPDIIAGLL